MKVNVSLIFSNNNLIGSKLIRVITNHFLKGTSFSEVPSHVSVLINDRWVHESTITDGVVISSIDKWSLKNNVVKIVPIDSIDYKFIKQKVRIIKNKKYDYLGALYLGLCCLLNKWFGTKLPTFNKWESHNRYFCTELVEVVLETYLSMAAPSYLLYLIKNEKLPIWVTRKFFGD